MPKNTSDIDKIISELDKYEQRVMLFLGKESISENKNIRLETIKNRLPDNYGKNVDKSLKRLISKHRLVGIYRNKNYRLNKLGRKVAQRLKEDFRDERYEDLSKILMVLN
ncbi:MAG: hypothetical protein HVN34_04765 [Methanobacteriaceae archaeon]|jgi:hypothetical protein|nr:hypothetical protein [Methanobacteriaceae archaeon]OPY24456.1 MAG: hypothetical protein A4E26_00359 [Methanobacterium sp. PtaU1.Bin097]